MATGFTPTYNTASSLADLYEKTNTTLKVGIKLYTEEAKWFRDYPRENVVYSPNETRIPIVLTKPTNFAMIPDGGYQSYMNTADPVSGTISMTQMNQRYAYTNLAQAIDNRARASEIERQTAFQAGQVLASMSFGIGMQTYGFTTGTLAVVKTTGGAGTTQVDIPLKNVYGSTLIAPASGASTAQLTYANTVLRVGQKVALIRSAALVEFGSVVASPAASAGVGYVDITFNSSITPTSGDLIVGAATVTDATITGTDYTRWPLGFLDVLTSTSVHGVSGSTYSSWNPGYTNTTGGNFNFAIKEAMINGVWNASGLQMNRLILSQGVRRDVIAKQKAAQRYDSSEFDLEGDLTKFKYLTSQLAPPGLAIGWNDQIFSRLELSDQPASDGDVTGSPNIFSMDKVQDRAAISASYDYFYCKVMSSRGGTAYASSLTEQ